MPFQRITRNQNKKRGPPKSTLDIINGHDATASQLDAQSNFGDILMWANDLKAAPEWWKVIQSTAGKQTMERRMPILHVGMIVKDPPKDVLDHYGLEEDPNGFNTYVFEGVQPHAHMMHLKDWIKRQYKTELPGSAAYWRRRVATEEFVPTEDLWVWIKEAKSLPYANKPLMKETWNGIFYMFVLEPSSFPALLRIGSKLVRNALVESFGPGILQRCAVELLSWIGWLVILNCFLTTLVYFGIPMMICTILNMDTSAPYKKGYGVNKDGTLKFMICSVVAAETIRRMGLWDEEDGPHPSMLLPKDYLPQGVGSDSNLFDMGLKSGVSYRKDLVRITNPYGAPSVHKKRCGSVFQAAGLSARNLRNSFVLAGQALAFDINEFQRDSLHKHRVSVFEAAGLATRNLRSEKCVQPSTEAAEGVLQMNTLMRGQLKECQPDHVGSIEQKRTSCGSQLLNQTTLRARQCL